MDMIADSAPSNYLKAVKTFLTLHQKKNFSPL